jgi:uncharacterized protein YfdQ (DUF2303 family)
MDMQNTRNLAESLADLLPKAAIVHTGLNEVPGLEIVHIAVPKGSEVKEVKVDTSDFLPNPRFTKAASMFTDSASFLEYVTRHAVPGSTVWCTFDPQAGKLSFHAVIDENTPDKAGWRRHTAKFTPDTSAEWKAWTGKNKTSMSQVEFAEWIQDHEDDIASSNSLPTSIQMLEMATNFVLHETHAVKSTVRLQGGGVAFEYIADQDAGTIERMKVFEFFGIAIPVFQGDRLASSLTARLKYRNNSGKLSFSYELLRADKAHQAAAEDIIKSIREGLGAVPLLMGACS